MSKDGEKCPSQHPRVKGDVLECLALSDQQSRVQRYSVYNGRRLRKLANIESEQAGTRELWHFLMK